MPEELEVQLTAEQYQSLFNELVESWRKLEDKKKAVDHRLDIVKEDIATLMKTAGVLNDHDRNGNSISLVETESVVYIVPKKEFELMLRKQGLEKQYLKTVLDMDRIKDAAKKGGIISDYIEVSPKHSPRFYEVKKK